MKKDFFIKDGKSISKQEMFLAFAEILDLKNIDTNFPKDCTDDKTKLYNWFIANLDVINQITESDLELIANNPTEEFKEMKEWINHYEHLNIREEITKILKEIFSEDDEQVSELELKGVLGLIDYSEPRSINRIFLSDYRSAAEDLQILPQLESLKMVKRERFENELCYRINEEFKLKIYLMAKMNLSIKNIDNVIEQAEEKYKIEDIDFESNKLKSNIDELIKYLKSIVSLYSDVQSLKKRYEHLITIRKKVLTNSISEYININNNANISSQEIDICYQNYNKYINDNNSSYSKELKSIDYELKYIIDCIEKDIKLQLKLYSYNIIYGKYRNYVAIASFVDYFSSGRISSLEGTDGAYNLYEQESRADIVISKLDDIINSLEKIKENQYYIYNELNNINNSLALINSQLLVNNILQVVQISELSEIIDNTNEIAYNTNVTSYYAKKIANHTKAIAIMQFLDRL